MPVAAVAEIREPMLKSDKNNSDDNLQGMSWILSVPHSIELLSNPASGGLPVAMFGLTAA